METISAGIDFGTTNTTAAITIPGESPHIVPIEGDAAATPSALFFEEKNDRLFFGRAAMKKYMDGDPGRFMRSLKRVLGTDLMRSGTVVNGQYKTFQDIIGAFIGNVKSRLDNEAARNIERVVMGRPVHFRDNDPAGDMRAEQELEKIARNAGFKNILFQFEPIAAAFAHERFLTVEQLAIVIDIGGGTSDFSIIRLGGAHVNQSDRTSDILANTGVRVGGNDFDKQLSLKTFMPEFGMGSTYDAGTVQHPKILMIPTANFFDLSEWSQINALYTYKSMNQADKYFLHASDPEKYGRMIEVMKRQQGHRLLGIVEKTKIELSDADAIRVPLDFLKSMATVDATRKEFEAAIENNASKILDSVTECVRMAGINPEKIQLVILTGGSTEIPYIRDILCGLFPAATVSADDKLSSVGLGLAFDAMRRFS